MRRRPGDGNTPAVLLLDGSAGPAARMSNEAADVMVCQALAAAERPAAFARSSWRRRRVADWMRGPLAAAAMFAMLASGVSAAAYVAGRQLVRFYAGAEEPTATPAPPEPMRAAPAPRPVRARVMPAPTARINPRAPAAAAAPRMTTQEALAAANDLRRRGAWADAARAYARVATSAGGTAVARSATLAAAALEVEHLSRPHQALQRYQGLLREPLPEPLDEEARWGIAECHRRLGNRQAEATALRGIVAAHPGGMLRARAESRLATLATPAGKQPDPPAAIPRPIP